MRAVQLISFIMKMESVKRYAKMRPMIISSIKELDRSTQRKLLTERRTYRRHSFHCGYSNIICRIEDLDGISQRYCLVINQWANEEEDTNFSLPCHGNAKTQNAKNTPFLRTEKNVSQSMKEDIKNGAKPQNVYQHAVCLSGGPFKSTTQSQQPRNQKQVFACYCLNSFLWYSIRIYANC